MTGISNIFRQLLKGILPISIFVLLSANAVAQKFPASANVRIIPPYSTYISDYFDPATGKLQATLNFNDFNEASWNVRLRLTIESSSIKMVTKPTFVPAIPIQLIPGAPYEIQGTDLQPYFDYNNLDIAGISKEELVRNGRLPEGMYNFCIEILDYATGKELSRPSCATAWLRLSNAPVVITPQCGIVVPAFNQQNILFQWQFLNTGSPVSTQTNFRFFLYEILDNTVNPMLALDNGKALLIHQEEDITNTALLYNLAMPTLETGKKYMFRIQAYDPDGKDMFKNNGFSENCWFSYGFPAGGIIELNKPASDFTLSKNDPQVFQWKAPNNLTPGQELNYKLKIVEISDGEDIEKALEVKAAWYEKQTITTSSNKPWQVVVDKPADAQKKFAWKVYAYSNGQEIAASEARTFTGPPLIESFRAGQHTLYIKQLDNLDLKNLSGTVRAKIFGNETDSTLTEAKFSNITIENLAGRYIMTRGEIVIDIPDTSKITLSPKIKDNKEAYFQVDKYRFTTEALEVMGYVKWPFPHPVRSEEAAFLLSEPEWINYNNFKIFGKAKLREGNDYELLEPYGFRINFQPHSDIFIVQNEYDLNLHGSIFLTERVKDFNGNRISFDFNYKQQIYYFTQNEITFSGDLHLIPNTQLAFRGKNAIIDFSDKESPLKLTDNKSFKGIYFDRFEVSYPQEVDASKQFRFRSSFTESYELLMNNNFKAWIDKDGITTLFREEFEDRQTATFNQFPTALTALEIDIEHNVVSDSRLTGDIDIPVIESGRKFSYTIPLSNGGFETGYLDEDLTGQSFVFSPYGGENRVDLTIKRAVFAQNERLDLIVDIEIPYIGATMTDVEDFRIYGDYYIGFGKRNGSMMLSQHVEGNYDGFTMFLDKIGCGLNNGEYVFSYSATVPLGDEVSGTEGPPRLDIFSSAPAGDNVARAEQSAGQEVPMDMKKPEIPAKNPTALAFDSLEIVVNSSIVDVRGYLFITKDDPEWGTSFQGGVNGVLKMPSRVELGTNMILGTREQLKYWYMDAWFVDSEGMGIKVFNMFNIVAFEGKIYRHMSHDKTAPATKDKPSFKVDPDVEFGTSLYMQLIDPGAGGKLVSSDVGIELVVKNDYFTVLMEGDISIANTKGRSGPGLAALKREIAEKAAKELAAKAVQELLNLDLSIPVGSGTLGIKAEKTKGSISYKTGDSEYTFRGDMTGIPKAGLTLVKGSNRFDLDGSVDGGGKIGFSSPAASLELGFAPSTGANFLLNFGNKSISALYDKNRDFGSFTFAYDTKLLHLELDKSQNKGKVALALDTDKRFSAEASQAGGAFEFQYDNVLVSLAANVQEQSGTLGVQVDDNYFNAGLNKTLGTGSLSFRKGNMSYGLAADRSGKGRLDIHTGSTDIVLDIDKPNGRGSIDVNVSGNSFGAYLDTVGMAGLNIGVGSVQIGMSVDKRNGAGGFLYDDGSRKIDIKANKSQGTGSVFIGFGSDSVVAALSPEEKRLAIGISNTYFGVKTDGSRSGQLSFRHGNKLIDLGADIQEQSGFITLQNGSDRLAIAANKTQRTGNFELKFSDVDVNAGISPERNFLNFQLNGIAFSGEGNSNGGSISFAKDDLDFAIGLRRAEGSGFVRFQKGPTRILAEANRAEKTGKLDFDIEGVNVTASVAPLNYRLSAKAPGTDLSLFTDGQTKGELSIGVADKRFALGADRNTGNGFFSMALGSDSLALTLDKTNLKGELAFKFGNYGMHSMVSAEKQFIKLNVPDASVSLTTQSSGVGIIDLKVQDVAVHLNADKVNGKGAFSLVKGTDSLGFAADLPNKSAGVLFAFGNTRFNAIYSTPVQKIDFSHNEYAFALEKTGAYAGKLSANFGSNSFTAAVDYQNKSGNIALNLEQISLNSGINLTSKTGNLSVSTGGVNYSMAVSDTAKELNFDYSGTEITARNSEEKQLLSFKYNDYLFKIEGQNNTGIITTMKGNFGMSFSTDKKIAFNYNNESYWIDLTAGKPDIRKNGSPLSYDLDNTGHAVIDFGTYTNNALNLKLVIDDKGKYLVYDNLISVGLEKSGNRYLTLEYQGQKVNLFQNSEKTGFSFGEKTAYYTAQGELIVEADATKKLKVSKTQLGVDYNNYHVALARESFSYSDGTQTVQISPEKLLLQQGERSLSFTNDYTFSLVAGTDKTLSISPEQVAVSYGSYNATFKKEPSFSFSDGTRIILLNTSELNVTQGDKSLVLKSDKSLQLKDGNNDLTVSTTQAAFNYNGSSFILLPGKSITYKDAERTFDISKEELAFSLNDKTFRLTKNLELEMAAGANKSVKISSSNVSLQYEDKKLSFGAEKALSYEDAERKFDFSTNGVELAQGEYKLKLTRDRSFELRAGESKALIINTDSAMVMYDGIEVALTADKSLRYQDNERYFVFGRQGISLRQGDKYMAFNMTEKSLELENGPDQKLKVSPTGAVVQYQDKYVEFGAEKSLSYKDSERSFDLAATGLSFAYQDYLLDVKNEPGNKGITLAKGSQSFSYSNGQATIIDGANQLTLGGQDRFFELIFDGKKIAAGRTNLSYQDGDRLIAFGGEKLVELKQGERSLTLSREKELQLVDGARSVSFSSTNGFVYSDETRSIGLGGQNLISYSQDGITYRLYSPERGKYGMGIQKDEYSLGLLMGRNTPTAVTASSSFGTLSVSTDPQSNIQANFKGGDKDITLKTGRQGLSITGIDIAGPGAVEMPDNLSTATEITDRQGPQYIGKITDGADGRAKGHVEMYFNSRDMHFIANASVKSVIPPCIEGALAAEASPQTWRVDIGNENERVSVYPTCSGFGGGGWLNLNPQNVGVGVFAGFRAGGSVDIGAAEITALVEAELGVRALVTIQPEFYINEAGVWVRVYAGLKVDPVVGSTFTVAEAELKGTLMLYFYPENTRVKGDLAGYINVCGIKGGFDMGFDKNI